MLNALNLFVVFAFVISLRISSFPFLVIDWDEAEIFKVSQEILNGGLPYKLAFSNKGPIVFYLLTPALSIFGNSVVALRVFTTAYLLFSMFVVWRIALRFTSNQVAWLAPLAYGVMFSNKALGGLASNGEIFMMLPVLLSLLFAMRGTTADSFFAGLSASAAFLIKTNAIFSLLPLLFIFHNKPKHWAAFLGGTLTLFLFTLGFFWLNNGLSEFIDAYFLFNSRYVSTNSTLSATLDLGDLLSRAFAVSFEPVSILGLCSFLLLWLRQKRKDDPLPFGFLSAAILGSLIGIWSIRRINPHHYLQIAFAWSLAIPLLVAQLRLLHENEKQIKFLVLGVFTYLTLTSSIFQIHKFQSRMQEERNNPILKTAEYIQKHTRPDDPIFVLGGQPIIYFLAERRAPTAYFFWLLHYGTWQEASQIQEKTLIEFEKNKPKYFVFAPHPLKVPYLEAFAQKYYLEDRIFGSYHILRLHKPR